MLLLIINRKPYMASPMTRWHLTLSDLERSKSRSLRLQSLISRKGAKLGPMLLLTNRKPYMGSPMAPSHLTLSDLEISNSRTPRFWSLISRKGTNIGTMLLLTINRKPYKASSMAPWYLTLSDCERSKSFKSRSLGSGWTSVHYAYTLLKTFKGSQFRLWVFSLPERI